jgi:hypothetical protein
MFKNTIFELVRMHDPAFAGVALEKVKRYARSREIADLPEVAPGALTPVRFHCRRLTRSQVLDFVELVALDNRKFARAFAAGVVRVTGGRFGDAGWAPENAESKEHLAMTDEELDEAGFAIADLLDIGQVIYLRSVAPFDCTPRYPLLLMSLAVWEGSALHFAEQSRDAAPQTSGPRKAA